MKSSGTGFFPSASQPAAAPAAERQREVSLEREPVREVEGNVVREGPDRVRIAQVIGATAAKKETYPERVARLQPLIDKQAAAVRGVATREGLDPSDFRIIYSFDISGEAGEVCAFCGREGCQYKPTAFLKENREIDLLKDAMTVAQEVATSLGASYGLIAYDDDLIPLREVTPPDGLSDRAAVIETFGKFKDRKERPDITDRAWLDEKLAKWSIEDKYRNVAGEPADAGMMELATKMMKSSVGSGPMALMLAKSEKPKTSLRPLESAARRAQITPAGLAVGQEAAQVKRNMFKNTVEVPENHGLVESIGAGTTAALELE